MLQEISKHHLVRNMPLEQRVQYKDEKVKHLQKMGCQMKGKIIIVIEYQTQNQWKNKCYVCSQKEKLSFILVNLKTKHNLCESLCLAIPKNRQVLSLMKTIKEVYEEYRNPDDDILYLSAVKYDYFGGQSNGE